MPFLPRKLNWKVNTPTALCGGRQGVGARETGEREGYGRREGRGREVGVVRGREVGAPVHKAL